MTIQEFVLTRAIIESENDNLIDASSELMSRRQMEDWAMEFINPQLDWKHFDVYTKKDFATDEELLAALKDSNYFYGRTIVKAALNSNRKVATEDYYINDNGDFHLKVPKRFLIKK